MAKFQRGKPVSADTLNEVMSAAGQIMDIKGEGIRVASGPGGTSVAIEPLDEASPNTILAQLVGAATVPIFGVVEIYQSWDRIGGKIVGRCRIPSQSGFARLGSAQQGMPSGRIGPVQNKGSGYVLFDIDSVPAGLVGQTRYRLGGKKNSYIAQYDQLGPFILIEDLGTLWSSTRLAVVEFTSERGDSKMLDNLTDSGPYKTYVWGADYTVTQTSTGEITIAVA